MRHIPKKVCLETINNCLPILEEFDTSKEHNLPLNLIASLVTIIALALKTADMKLMDELQEIHVKVHSMIANSKKAQEIHQGFKANIDKHKFN